MSLEEKFIKLKTELETTNSPKVINLLQELYDEVLDLAVSFHLDDIIHHDPHDKEESIRYLKLADEIQAYIEKVRFTEVTNLATGDKAYYSLPPYKAVICAYEQFHNKNFNTWEYDFSESRLIIGERSVACGDYCAMKA